MDTSSQQKAIVYVTGNEYKWYRCRKITGIRPLKALHFRINNLLVSIMTTSAPMRPMTANHHSPETLIARATLAASSGR